MKTISEKENLQNLKGAGKFFIIALGLILLIGWVLKPEDSMTKCQETHSFDTCFTILNR